LRRRQADESAHPASCRAYRRRSSVQSGSRGTHVVDQGQAAGRRLSAAPSECSIHVQAAFSGGLAHLRARGPDSFQAGYKLEPQPAGQLPGYCLRLVEAALP
jgi:hypothetical protein